MARKNESLPNLLIRLPWWISIVLAGLVLIVSHFVIPNISFENPFLKGFALGAPNLGAFVAFALCVISLMSAIESWRKRRLFSGQKGLDTIKKLNWQEFEELVGEAFRRQGYFVLENPGKGPDGGVDLRLRKDGRKIYVQCKHWKTSKVSVKVVRELFGVMAANGADEGIVVTYGEYTGEARGFAQGKPMRLINGKQLSRMIRDVQNSPSPVAEPVSPPPPEPLCPKCGSPMVLRTAKRGSRAGQKFWGCSKFPQCRGTLSITDQTYHAA
jgi:restriction system protein